MCLNSWRPKEADLFILKEILEYYDSEDKTMSPEIANAFLPYVRASIEDGTCGFLISILLAGFVQETG